MKVINSKHSSVLTCRPFLRVDILTKYFLLFIMLSGTMLFSGCTFLRETKESFHDMIMPLPPVHHAYSSDIEIIRDQEKVATILLDPDSLIGVDDIKDTRKARVTKHSFWQSYWDVVDVLPGRHKITYTYNGRGIYRSTFSVFWADFQAGHVYYLRPLFIGRDPAYSEGMFHLKITEDVPERRKQKIIAGRKKDS